MTNKNCNDSILHMNNYSQINRITLPKTILKEQGVAILDLKFYERLQNKIKELKEKLKRQKELEEVKAIIAEGDKDYKRGRTISASSIEEALRINAKKRN